MNINPVNYKGVIRLNNRNLKKKTEDKIMLLNIIINIKLTSLNIFL